MLTILKQMAINMISELPEHVNDASKLITTMKHGNRNPNRFLTFNLISTQPEVLFLTKHFLLKFL